MAWGIARRRSVARDPLGRRPAARLLGHGLQGDAVLDRLRPAGLPRDLATSGGRSACWRQSAFRRSSSSPSLPAAGNTALGLGVRMYATPAQLTYVLLRVLLRPPASSSCHTASCGGSARSPYAQEPPDLIGSVYFPGTGTHANAGLWADAYANFGVAGILAFTRRLRARALGARTGCRATATCASWAPCSASPRWRSTRAPCSRRSSPTAIALALLLILFMPPVDAAPAPGAGDGRAAGASRAECACAPSPRCRLPSGARVAANAGERAVPRPWPARAPSECQRPDTRPQHRHRR